MRSWIVSVCAGAFLAGCGGGDPGTPKGCDPQSVQTNVDSCGSCGTICPDQPHSGGRTCVAGVCGRKPCEAGWMDLDPKLPGCETAGNPGTTETGLVFAAVTAGGSYSPPLSNDQHQNQGALGEPTPAPEGGAVSTQSAQHQNVSGFNSILH